jgi:hypothetical protein
VCEQGRELERAEEVALRLVRRREAFRHQVVPVPLPLAVRARELERLAQRRELLVDGVLADPEGAAEAHVGADRLAGDLPEVSLDTTTGAAASLRGDDEEDRQA